MTLREELANVQSREDLGCFVRLLAQDVRDHPDNWENHDLWSYLEALSGWITDMEGYFRNTLATEAPDQPTWHMIGMMLLAATVYE